MKLYMHPMSPNTRKPEWVARHLDLPVELVEVQLHLGEHRSPAFLAMNPDGRIPVLSDGDFHLHESNAIMRYLARKAGGALLGATEQDRARVESWLDNDLAHFGFACRLLLWRVVISPLLRGKSYGEDEIEEARKGLRREAKVLEGSLANRRWLVGDDITLADMALVCSADAATTAGMDWSDFPAIAAWLERARALPSWPGTAKG